MKVIHTVKEMQDTVRRLKREGKTIGYVPTMGYLHEGHLHLMKEARKQNDIVVASIFVNPTQFGPNEDFESYPRDFERDCLVASDAGVDYIFHPTVEEMYPKPLSIKLSAVDRTDCLCGASRPGHFDGVVTVLTKFFHIVTPDKAYFGMKDAQQVAVVESLVSDYFFPIELIPVDTVREEDGLAKSSRNVNLTEKERREAPVLYESLTLAKNLIESGERNIDKILSAVRERIQENTSGKIDYIEMYSYPELKKIEQIKGKIIIALAVKFSKARLIDNIVLNVE